MRPLERGAMTGYGWDRSRIGTLEGARTWVGHGVLTHNLIKIAALTN